LLCVFVGALVTAVALLRLGALLTTAPTIDHTDRGDGAANVVLVRDFYDAVNAALRGGPLTDLERRLAAGFVAHGGPPGLPPARAGFVRHVRALRATFPEMPLRAQEVSAHGDVVVARVRIEGAARGAFLRLPLPGSPPPWGGVDLFRIAAGAVAEHWGGRAHAPLLEPLQQAPLDVPPTAAQTLALTRTTVAPGGSLAAWIGRGTEVRYLETGTLTVAVISGATGPARHWRSSPPGSADPPDAVVTGSETALAPGDVLLVPAGTWVTTRNDGGAAATFLAVALHRPGGAGGAAPASMPPIAIPIATPVAIPVAIPAVGTTDLMGNVPTKLPGGPAVLGFGRATLAPGGTFPVAAPGAALLAVEAGELSVAIAAGTVWRRHGADGTIATTSRRLLEAGDAVLVEPGADTEVRNAGDGPLVRLVVTLTPGRRTSG
jgi:quercetin dioxygenase-like cupin family protein/predicted ester cyclase